jgi:hypothetical protein
LGLRGQGTWAQKGNRAGRKRSGDRPVGFARNGQVEQVEQVGAGWGQVEAKPKPKPGRDPAAGAIGAGP